VTPVIALARGPLSRTEFIVLYAIAAEGADPSNLWPLTGLTDEVIEDALAQLVRRGLLHRTIREMRLTADTSSPSALALSLVDGDQPDKPSTPRVPAA
jgi:hypothetical protein